jgi:hypothetical protein
MYAALRANFSSFEPAFPTTLLVVCLQLLVLLQHTASRKQLVRPTSTVHYDDLRVRDGKTCRDWIIYVSKGCSMLFLLILLPIATAAKSLNIRLRDPQDIARAPVEPEHRKILTKHDGPQIPLHREICWKPQSQKAAVAGTVFSIAFHAVSMQWPLNGSAHGTGTVKVVAAATASRTKSASSFSSEVGTMSGALPMGTSHRAKGVHLV